MRDRLALFSCLVLLSTLLAGKLFAAENPLPFTPGEKLTFQVRWSFIPAAKAVLEIHPVETLNGRKAYHFTMISRTHSLVDIFYKVRDRIDSDMDAEMTHSLRYKNLQDGKRKRKVVVTFDWAKNLAQFSNFGQKRSPISIFPGSFDPLSVFYAFRLYPLAVGKVLKVPVSDGKKCVIGKAHVLRKEEINLRGTIVDTFLVEPELEQVGGVFERSPKAKVKIWVSADNKRIPVKFESKVVVGSFVAELVSPSIPGRPVSTNKASAAQPN